MATKEWHLLISGPDSTWSKLYDRHFDSVLTLGREKRLYQQLEFDFDPLIHVEATVYDQIKNDSAFIGTAFGGFKRIIDAMLKELAETIKKSAGRKRKKQGAELQAAGESRAAFEARLQKEADEARDEKVKELNKELLWILMQYESKLETEAERQLDAWTGLPKDVKRYERSQKKSKARIVVLSSAAVTGAALATASVALGFSPASLIASIGAWYGAVRTIAGGVQEWKLMNMNLASLMEAMKKDLEEFSKQTNHKTRAVAAGALAGATGMQLMTQIGPFEAKLTQLNGKLPQLKLNESTRGKALNEFLDVAKDLEAKAQTFRDDPAKSLGSPDLAESWKVLEFKIAKVQIDIERLLKNSGASSHELEIWSKAVQEHVNKLRLSRGQAAEKIEIIVRALVSVGLSSGVAGGMAGWGGIDFNATLHAARAAAAIDTTGLVVGGLSDLEGAVGNFQALLSD